MDTASPRPFLSVVVATGERGELLPAAFESLARQTLARDAFEVVVVTHGPPGHPADAAPALAARLPLRVSRSPAGGEAGALNEGISLARGEIVLLFDGELAADPSLLERHCELHRRFPEPRRVVVGALAVADALRPDPLARFRVELEEPAPGGDGATVDLAAFRRGRSSAKRAFLLEQGGFDPAVRPACSDLELAWRLSRAGLEVVLDDATARVLRAPTFDELCDQAFRRGEAELELTRLHPDEALQRRTGVGNAASAWRALAPVRAALLRSARELDRLVRARIGAGLEVGEPDLALLRRGYWIAFLASRIEGIVHRAGELGLPLPDATPPGA